jgi:cyclopropane fatty-acyl-phospholipid synthase-like methyltransferase
MEPGERVIDLGSGAGCDAMVAAGQIRPVGGAWDTFERAGGETIARAFEVYGFPFLARAPR